MRILGMFETKVFGSFHGLTTSFAGDLIQRLFAITVFFVV